MVHMGIEFRAGEIKIDLQKKWTFHRISVPLLGGPSA